MNIGVHEKVYIVYIICFVWGSNGRSNTDMNNTQSDASYINYGILCVVQHANGTFHALAGAGICQVVTKCNKYFLTFDYTFSFYLKHYVSAIK